MRSSHLVEAEDVVKIVDFLETLGNEVWLDGGWGVDALLGRQTRPHRDLDLVVPLGDMMIVQDALTQRGYRLIRGGAPMSFRMTDHAVRQIDAHSVAFRPSGDGLFEMDNGGDWLCPAAGFDGVGHVLGSGVRCLTPEAKIQRICRSGYDLDQAHLNDVIALCERYGIPVPDDVS